MARRRAAPVPEATPNSGLEGAPDIMLLTMAGLMVAIVWLSAHAQERTLPPLSLPQSEVGALGLASATPLHVTLKPAGGREGTGAGAVLVFIEDEPLRGGLAELPAALEARRGGSITLRADAGLPWQAVLDVMSSAARWDIAVNVAVDR